MGGGAAKGTVFREFAALQAAAVGTQVGILERDWGGGSRYVLKIETKDAPYR